MKTFFGVDYYKAFSYGAVMTETGEILKQGRFGNHPESVGRFLGEHGGKACSAVLEATRNWCVMHDWLEELTGQVTLAHPLKVKAIERPPQHSYERKWGGLGVPTQALSSDCPPGIEIWQRSSRIATSRRQRPELWVTIPTPGSTMKPLKPSAHLGPTRPAMGLCS